MKKMYTNPRIELLSLFNEDVLTDSLITTNNFKTDVYSDGWKDSELF